ncbi:TetR/AcrR family transcriptional regulator [Microterricola viridarii]|uniref:DNA-binding transcriptional regulator, AcrR family n=1 Tax=Microterricola viridarii TaxID=412690 RepID=A0A1H1ZCD1_9MICO|nr:TetR family transcriptional regulator [Microterricola viridarii]SDT31162.1 DNA-binding transcriptional regulator, AcrR family [Microterricola viridarii]
MPHTATPAPEGLRARKRRATENAIEMASVELALELGFDHVTVEAICERADVSRSTLFNYFPSRDAAIVGRPIPVLGGEEAAAVLDQAPDDLTRGLYKLIFASIGHAHVNSDVARMRARLAAEQPAARRVGTILLVETGERLMEAAASWLRAHPELAKLPGEPEREASLATNAVYAALTVMAGGWLSSVGDVEASEADFERAMAQLRAVI